MDFDVVYSITNDAIRIFETVSHLVDTMWYDKNYFIVLPSLADKRKVNTKVIYFPRLNSYNMYFWKLAERLNNRYVYSRIWILDECQKPVYSKVIQQIVDELGFYKFPYRKKQIVAWVTAIWRVLVDIFPMLVAVSKVEIYPTRFGTSVSFFNGERHKAIFPRVDLFPYSLYEGLVSLAVWYMSDLIRKLTKLDIQTWLNREYVVDLLFKTTKLKNFYPEYASTIHNISSFVELEYIKQSKKYLAELGIYDRVLVIEGEEIVKMCVCVGGGDQEPIYRYTYCVNFVYKNLWKILHI